MIRYKPHPDNKNIIVRENNEGEITEGYFINDDFVPHWFRYEDVLYASSVDEFGDSMGDSKVELRMRSYRVIRETPKGVWLTVGYANNFYYGDKGKFVLRNAHKRFACPTIEEAKRSFIARKKRQISIYNARIQNAREALNIVNGSRYGIINSI